MGKSYRIQLTGGQLLWVSVLSFMSLGVSFYLGLVTGNSLRSPVNDVLQQSVKESANVNTSLSPEQLEFFNSLDNTQKQKTVLSSKKLDKIKETTLRLQKDVLKGKTIENKKSQTEVSVEQVPETSERVSVEQESIKQEKELTEPKPKIDTEVVETKEVIRSSPALIEAKQVDLFTLQVFTSSNREKAEKLVKRLIESGYFDAYLQPFENEEKKVLYRVRIAKINKSSAESLAEKIKKLGYIEHVQIRRL